MENKTPTFKDHVMFLEKAIDVAITKGSFNKMEVVQLVQSLTHLYQLAEKHENCTPFKGVPPTE